MEKVFFETIIIETWNYINYSNVKTPERSFAKTDILHFLGTIMILKNLSISIQNIERIYIETSKNFLMEEFIEKYDFLKKYQEYFDLIEFKKTISIKTNIIDNHNNEKNFNVDALIKLKDYSKYKEIVCLFKMPLKSINKNIFNYLNTTIAEAIRAFKNDRLNVFLDLYPKKTSFIKDGKCKIEDVLEYFYEEKTLKELEMKNNFIHLKINYIFLEYILIYLKNNEKFFLRKKDFYLENLSTFKEKLKNKKL